MTATKIKTPNPLLRVTWDDPTIGPRTAKTMSGINYLRAMQKGELPYPPVYRLIGYTIEQIDVGLSVFEFEPAEYHYNAIGTVHGVLSRERSGFARCSFATLGLTLSGP